ncbi:DNA repair protein RAD51 like protein 2 [Chelonia mydas]|uniref:DNA repair protein RAD51 like protein 2 n=1 Tax=Chelonia mydas TaxID=8469 RepID=M7CIX9_CHEMY|nr:DNA repair protein RAD51 like protein 2 [Chelonia mydas]
MEDKNLPMEDKVILTNQITTRLSNGLDIQADLVSPADDMSLSEGEALGQEKPDLEEGLRRPGLPPAEYPEDLEGPGCNPGQREPDTEGELELPAAEYPDELEGPERPA